MAPDNGETSHISNPAPSNTTAQQQACRNRILHECLFGQWYSQRMLNLVLDSSYTEVLTQVIEQAEFGCTFWEQVETRTGETEWNWYFLLTEPAFCPEAIARVPGLKTWLLYEARLSWKHINRIDEWMWHENTFNFRELIGQAAQLSHDIGISTNGTLHERFLRKARWAYRHTWSYDGAPNLSAKARKRQQAPKPSYHHLIPFDLFLLN